MQHCFKLLAPGVCVVFSASTTQDKVAWVTNLRKTIKALGDEDNSAGPSSKRSIILDAKARERAKEEEANRKKQLEEEEALRKKQEESAKRAAETEEQKQLEESGEASEPPTTESNNNDHPQGRFDLFLFLILGRLALISSSFRVASHQGAIHCF